MAEHFLWKEMNLFNNRKVFFSISALLADFLSKTFNNNLGVSCRNRVDFEIYISSEEFKKAERVLFLDVYK